MSKSIITTAQTVNGTTFNGISSPINQLSSTSGTSGIDEFEIDLDTVVTTGGAGPVNFNGNCSVVIGSPVTDPGTDARDITNVNGPYRYGTEDEVWDEESGYSSGDKVSFGVRTYQVRAGRSVSASTIVTGSMSMDFDNTVLTNLVNSGQQGITIGSFTAGSISLDESGGTGASTYTSFRIQNDNQTNGGFFAPTSSQLNIFGINRDNSPSNTLNQWVTAMVAAINDPSGVGFQPEASDWLRFTASESTSGGTTTMTLTRKSGVSWPSDLIVTSEDFIPYNNDSFVLNNTGGNSSPDVDTTNWVELTSVFPTWFENTTSVVPLNDEGFVDIGARTTLRFLDAYDTNNSDENANWTMVNSNVTDTSPIFYGVDFRMDTAGNMNFVGQADNSFNQSGGRGTPQFHNCSTITNGDADFRFNGNNYLINGFSYTTYGTRGVFEFGIAPKFTPRGLSLAIPNISDLTNRAFLFFCQGGGVTANDNDNTYLFENPSTSNYVPYNNFNNSNNDADTGAVIINASDCPPVPYGDTSGDLSENTTETIPMVTKDLQGSFQQNQCNNTVSFLQRVVINTPSTGWTVRVVKTGTTVKQMNNAGAKAVEWQGRERTKSPASLITQSSDTFNTSAEYFGSSSAIPVADVVGSTTVGDGGGLRNLQVCKTLIDNNRFNTDDIFVPFSHDGDITGSQVKLLIPTHTSAPDLNGTFGNDGTFYFNSYKVILQHDQYGTKVYNIGFAPDDDNLPDNIGGPGWNNYDLTVDTVEDIGFSETASDYLAAIDDFQGLYDAIKTYERLRVSTSDYDASHRTSDLSYLTRTDKSFTTIDTNLVDIPFTPLTDSGTSLFSDFPFSGNQLRFNSGSTAASFLTAIGITSGGTTATGFTLRSTESGTPQDFGGRTLVQLASPSNVITVSGTIDQTLSRIGNLFFENTGGSTIQSSGVNGIAGTNMSVKTSNSFVAGDLSKVDTLTMTGNIDMESFPSFIGVTFNADTVTNVENVDGTMNVTSASTTTGDVDVKSTGSLTAPTLGITGTLTSVTDLSGLEPVPGETIGTFTTSGVIALGGKHTGTLTSNATTGANSVSGEVTSTLVTNSSGRLTVSGILGGSTTNSNGPATTTSTADTKALTIGAGDSIIGGTIVGNVGIGAGDSTVSGNITGNLTVGNGDTTSSGSVSGTSNYGTGEQSLSGTATGSVTATGRISSNIDFNASSTVTAGDGDSSIAGTITGAVTLGDATTNHSVSGDLSNTLTMGDGTKNEVSGSVDGAVSTTGTIDTTTSFIGGSTVTAGIEDLDSSFSLFSAFPFNTNQLRFNSGSTAASFLTAIGITSGDTTPEFFTLKAGADGTPQNFGGVTLTQGTFPSNIIIVSGTITQTLAQGQSLFYSSLLTGDSNVDGSVADKVTLGNATTNHTVGANITSNGIFLGTGAGHVVSGMITGAVNTTGTLATSETFQVSSTVTANTATGDSTINSNSTGITGNVLLGDASSGHTFSGSAGANLTMGSGAHTISGEVEGNLSMGTGSSTINGTVTGTVVTTGTLTAGSTYSGGSTIVVSGTGSSSIDGTSADKVTIGNSSSESTGHTIDATISSNGLVMGTGKHTVNGDVTGAVTTTGILTTGSAFTGSSTVTANTATGDSSIDGTITGAVTLGAATTKHSVPGTLSSTLTMGTGTEHNLSGNITGNVSTTGTIETTETYQGAGTITANTATGDSTINSNSTGITGLVTLGNASSGHTVSGVLNTAGLTMGTGAHTISGDVAGALSTTGTVTTSSEYTGGNTLSASGTGSSSVDGTSAGKITLGNSSSSSTGHTVNAAIAAGGLDMGTGTHSVTGSVTGAITSAGILSTGVVFDGSSTITVTGVGDSTIRGTSGGKVTLPNATIGHTIPGEITSGGLTMGTGAHTIDGDITGAVTTTGTLTTGLVSNFSSTVTSTATGTVSNNIRGALGGKLTLTDGDHNVSASITSGGIELGDGDHTVSSTVTLGGMILGDGDSTFTGNVTGTTSIGVGDNAVSGTITGDTTIGAGDNTLDGTIVGDVTIGNGNTALDATITGDLTTGTGDIDAGFNFSMNGTLSTGTGTVAFESANDVSNITLVAEDGITITVSGKVETDFADTTENGTGEIIFPTGATTRLTVDLSSLSIGSTYILYNGSTEIAPVSPKTNTISAGGNVLTFSDTNNDGTRTFISTGLTGDWYLYYVDTNKKATFKGLTIGVNPSVTDIAELTLTPTEIGIAFEVPTANITGRVLTVSATDNQDFTTTNGRLFSAFPFGTNEDVLRFNNTSFARGFMTAIGGTDTANDPFTVGSIFFLKVGTSGTPQDFGGATFTRNAGNEVTVSGITIDQELATGIIQFSTENIAAEFDLGGCPVSNWADESQSSALVAEARNSVNYLNAMARQLVLDGTDIPTDGSVATFDAVRPVISGADWRENRYFIKDAEAGTQKVSGWNEVDDLITFSNGTRTVRQLTALNSSVDSDGDTQIQSQSRLITSGTDIVSRTSDVIRTETGPINNVLGWMVDGTSSKLVGIKPRSEDYDSDADYKPNT